jgi:protease IV
MEDFMFHERRLGSLSLTLLLMVLIVPRAHAQQVDANEIDPTGGVLLPSPSITETGDASVLAVNPANIAFLDAWNLTYVGAWVQDQKRLAGQGHGFFFGLPLGSFVGFGFGIEPLAPPVEIVEWQGLGHRTRFSLGLSFNLKRIIGIGLAYRTYWFEDIGDIHTMDFGLTIHPANHLALSFVFQDVNAPDFKYRYWQSDESRWSDPYHHRAPRVFKVGMTVRPLGTDRLSLGAELKYMNGDADEQLRGATGSFSRTDIMAFLFGKPIHGLTLKLRFLAEALRDSRRDTAYILDGSLGIALPNFEVGAGVVGQIAPEAGQEYQGTSWYASIHGERAPALPMPIPLRSAHVVVIDQKSPMNTYEFAGRVALLERIARDTQVDMVLLRPEAGTMSLAQAEEFRHQVDRLQDAGKVVACYLTTPNGPVYLSCAGADHLWVNPVGGLRFAGISTRIMYLGDLFDNLGIKADMVRIGEYKSFPETLTRDSPTEPSREQTDQYMDNIYAEVLSMLRRDRGFHTTAAVEKLIDQGPFMAEEALAGRLVDELVATDELETRINEIMGRQVFFDMDYINSTVRRPYYIDAPAVAVVHIDGDIVDGESVDIPLLDIKMTGAKTLTETLRQVRGDSRIHAVVLRINSPGGSAVASDIIWREVMALRKEKPVIASLGSIAASGGYYIATAADEIYTDAMTLTGSIGVFGGKADLSSLAHGLGVNTVTFKRGKHADIESWMRPYTEEERELLRRHLYDYYNLFLERVITGRNNGLTAKIVDRVGRGRIWSGADAKYHLLVDQLGGYADALGRAREVAGVPEDMKVFHYPKPIKNLLTRAADTMMALVREPSAVETFVKMSGMHRFLAPLFPFATLDAFAPRARLPFAIVDDPSSTFVVK